VYAEQFADPDPEKALPPEELLSRARMILATELGRDPILRHEIRHLYQKEALISCLPTEKGISKLTAYDKVFVSTFPPPVLQA
jgi:transcription elongation factor SPT6